MDTLAITHTLIPDCLVLPKSFMTGLCKMWKKKRNCKGADMTSRNREQNLARQTHLAGMMRF